MHFFPHCYVILQKIVKKEIGKCHSFGIAH
nr:MAG TPA: hypothetical protein [Caudoviricetes sp.]